MTQLDLQPVLDLQPLDQSSTGGVKLDLQPDTTTHTLFGAIYNSPLAQSFRNMLARSDQVGGSIKSPSDVADIGEAVTHGITKGIPMVGVNIEKMLPKEQQTQYKDVEDAVSKVYGIGWTAAIAKIALKNPLGFVKQIAGGTAATEAANAVSSKLQGKPYNPLSGNSFTDMWKPDPKDRKQVIAWNGLKAAETSLEFMGGADLSDLKVHYGGYDSGLEMAEIEAAKPKKWGMFAPAPQSPETAKALEALRNIEAQNSVSRGVSDTLTKVNPLFGVLDQPSQQPELPFKEGVGEPEPVREEPKTILENAVADTRQQVEEGIRLRAKGIKERNPVTASFGEAQVKGSVDDFMNHLEQHAETPQQKSAIEALKQSMSEQDKVNLLRQFVSNPTMPVEAIKGVSNQHLVETAANLEEQKRILASNRIQDTIAAQAKRDAEHAAVDNDVNRRKAASLKNEGNVFELLKQPGDFENLRKAAKKPATEKYNTEMARIKETYRQEMAKLRPLSRRNILEQAKNAWLSGVAKDHGFKYVTDDDIKTALEQIKKDPMAKQITGKENTSLNPGEKNIIQRKLGDIGAFFRRQTNASFFGNTLVEVADAGVDNGVWHQTVSKPMDAMGKKTLLEWHYGMSQLLDKMAGLSKDHNGDLDEVFSRIKNIAGMEMTEGEHLALVAASQQPAGRAILKDGGKIMSLASRDGQPVKFTEEMLQEAEKSLTPEELDVIKWVKEDYAKDFPELAAAYYHNTGQLLNPLENYSRLFVKFDFSDPDMTLGYANTGTGLAGANVAKSRTGQTEFPLREGGLFDEYSQTKKMIREYTNFGAIKKSVMKLVDDPEVAKAMKTAYGEDFYNPLRERIQRTFNAYRGNDKTSLDEAFKYVRETFPVATIGYNWGTPVKHIYSQALPTILDNGPRFFSAMADFMKDPKGISDSIYSKSKMLKADEINTTGENETLRKAHEPAQGPFKLWRDVKSHSYDMINWVVHGTKMIGWKAKYDATFEDLIRRGVGAVEADNRAIDIADKQTNKYFPTSGKFNQSNISAGGELSKSFNIFGVTPAKIAQYITTDIWLPMRRGKITPTQAAYLYTTRVVLPAFLIDITFNRKDYTNPNTSMQSKAARAVLLAGLGPYAEGFALSRAAMRTAVYGARAASGMPGEEITAATGASVNNLMQGKIPQAIDEATLPVGVALKVPGAQPIHSGIKGLIKLANPKNGGSPLLRGENVMPEKGK